MNHKNNRTYTSRSSCFPTEADQGSLSWPLHSTFPQLLHYVPPDFTAHFSITYFIDGRNDRQFNADHLCGLQNHPTSNPLDFYVWTGILYAKVVHDSVELRGPCLNWPNRFPLSAASPTRAWAGHSSGHVYWDKLGDRKWQTILVR